MTNTERLLRIFLCHSSSDKVAVRQLYQRLRDEGFDPWLDEERLLPGQDWHLEIQKAVHDADVVLACLSNTSVTKKGYLQREIKYALDVADEQPEGAIFLIPLKLENCEVPYRLRQWQWVNFFESGGVDKLLQTLRMRANHLDITEAPMIVNTQSVASIETLTPMIDNTERVASIADVTLFMKDKRIFKQVKTVYCNGKMIGFIWKEPLYYQIEPGKHSISFQERREGFSFTNMIMTISAAGRHAYETGGRDRSKDYDVDYGPYFISVQRGSNVIRFLHTREGITIE